jgi:hypothetical protein
MLFSKITIASTLALAGLVVAVSSPINLDVGLEHSANLFAQPLDPSNRRNGHGYCHLYPPSLDFYLYKGRHGDGFALQQVQQQIKHLKHVCEIIQQHQGANKHDKVDNDHYDIQWCDRSQ